MILCGFSMIQTLFGSTEEKKTGFFDRMKQAVTRTRENLADSIEDRRLPSAGRSIVRLSTILKAHSSALIWAPLPPRRC